jgi:cold shock CspA family protein
MPTGVVVWFDERAGEGIIRRDGREYPVRSAGIERAARVPSARVHFDIARLEGVKRAVNVTLRRGRRVGPGQHRFGDLAGAHHPDEKGHHPLTDDHPGLDPAYEGRPVALIEEWVRLVNDKDLDTLRLLYLPQAVLHIGSDVVVGRDAITHRLQDELVGPRTQKTTVHEHDNVVSTELSVGDHRLSIDFEVAHGRVAEQWM